MNTINTNEATNPFVTKTEGSASTSVKLDTDSFDRIDKKATESKDDTVNFSSKSQFMLNLQIYAHTLSDEERNQFVDTLEQSDDGMFNDEFLKNLRNPPTFAIESWDAVREELAGDPLFCGLPEGTTQEITVMYSGVTKIGTWNFHELSRSRDIHETDYLTRKLEQLKVKASKELSKQDLATITGTMDVSVGASKNFLNSSYALFRTNYDYEVAAQAILKLPMSDGLKKEYSILLSDIRSSQSQKASDYIDQQERKIQNFPQFEGTIREEIQALKEGLEINKELQQKILHSKNGLFGLEDSFQMLIRNSESIKGESSENISDMFNHFTDQINEFNRIFIEKDRGASLQSKPQQNHPALDLAFNETQELTNQYISAIKTHMADNGTP